jgi:hypothetical protein
MGLSTTDLPVGGGSSLPKTIAPGNHTLKINSVYLDDFRFIEGAKHLMMNVETEPIEGFEGFMIDRDNGRVKASQYAFADGQTKSGIQIHRDKSILMFLSNLCKALGKSDWFVAQDNKHDTIEEFVAAFNDEKPFEGVYLDFCIAGKEYENKNGYTNYDMWLPKSSKQGYAFAEHESDRVLQYSEADHLIKMQVNKVDSFGDDDDVSIPSKTSSDFSLD